MAVQVASLLFPAVDVPDEALRYVWLIAASLLPLVIVFSWSYDVSLDGIRRTPPAAPGENFDPSLRRLDYALIVALAVIAVSLTIQFGTKIEAGPHTLDDSIDRFSIAVLPFDDLSGKAEEQFFISGMQSSLIDGLSRVRNLRVTSKVSTLPYRESGGSLLEIATQLGVARLVEGTVLRSGDRVSIALRLHDAETDRQVWSATFEDKLENIMLLQSRAAQEIANQVRVQLGPEEREQFAAARPVNQEAYLAFLRGVFHVERFNPDDMRIAATHFQRAVEIDPEFALGHWGLSKLCGFQAQAGVITPAEARERCLPPVYRALELDPFLPEAHFGLAAMTTWQLFDFDAARQHWERALELNPSYAEGHVFFSHYLAILGELETSSHHMQKALALDPNNPFVVGLYSVQLAMLDKFDEAIEQANRALNMAPGYAFGWITLALAHDTLGNHEKAIDAYANFFRYVHGRTDVADILEQTFAHEGYAAANLAAGEFLIRKSKTSHVPPMHISTLLEFGGDYERSLDYMEIAVNGRDPDAPYIGAVVKDPVMRRNPRYKQLVSELGLGYWAAIP
ncbi:MAG: hypothetical protein R3358_04405 [Woeseiaceae bacterium]|nr:hypothetical protein [Woeseiaceae bacterium]